ncbi:hypothetical protein KCG43_11370 [Photobacterium sp. WH24]|uniref:S24 family peptidase n=1 Tax=Photobacterium sp. WH24 TaxID=2827237 RepID=UPI001C46AE30|nr:S24 family peptidase [Photobacterium sp. WH24]MBV7262596.1 hypothetical protein [Photobacterium sp. WH24]
MTDKKQNTQSAFYDEGIAQFPDRLLELIGDESKLSFGRKVGITDSGLRKYLPPGGTSMPTLEKLVAIARYKKVNLEWLATGKGPKDVFPSSVYDPTCGSGGFLNISSELAIVDEENQHTLTQEPVCSVALSDLDEEYVLIPGYHAQIPSSSDLSELPVKRHMAFRRKYLSYRRLNPCHLVVLFNKGDAMEGTINDNDSVLVDISKRDLIDGKIFVVRLGNELYPKRIQKSFDGSVVIISDNKEYQSITIPAEKVDQLYVFGRVVNVSSDL